MLAGSLSAHELSYWLVAPDAHTRAHLLAESGHGYYRHLPLALATLGALLLLTLAGRIAQAARRGPLAAPAAYPFFLLPLVGFSLQEHLERLLHTGDLPLGAALEPTFLVGLVLQLPFSLAAYACARLLLAAADRLGRALAGRPPARPVRPLALILPAARELPPRRSALALGHAQRGPPLPAR
jgi:Zn-dependent protease with chaperone function